jgi:demethylmenaquinone methyltransferase/2-methoxy-6-polyprenyl-1,4-benzoquinol methylase
MTEPEIAYFDRLAPTWDANEFYSTPQRINQVLDLMNIKEGMHVLDLGTGTGVMMPYLLERVGSEGKVLGVDISEGMLQQACQKSDASLFLRADIEKDRLPGKYHRIIMYCVYPHLSRPVSTIKKIVSQNLVNNGTLSIAFPTVAANINSVHRNRHIYSRLLPSAVTLALQLQTHHIVANSISNDPYVVTVSRR